MSRTNKIRQKRKTHIKHARWDAAFNKSLSTEKRGAKQTTPKHGKVRTWPYVAEARNQIAGRHR